MKIEQQVCSLELAKKLKELGVKQESHFMWFPQIGFVDEKTVGEDEDIVEREVISSIDSGWYISCDKKEEMRPHIVSAFTVAELGEMLPIYVTSGKKDNGTWYSATISNGMGWKEESFNADTEADARAKMLIYLLENKLINP